MKQFFKKATEKLGIVTSIVIIAMLLVQGIILGVIGTSATKYSADTIIKEMSVVLAGVAADMVDDTLNGLIAQCEDIGTNPYIGSSTVSDYEKKQLFNEKRKN